MATTLRRLGHKAFDAAFARGRAMTTSQVVAFAVEGKQPPTGKSMRRRARNP